MGRSTIQLAFVALVGACSLASGQTIANELVVAGLSSPLDLSAPPGDPRLFVVEQAGRIRIIEGGTLLPAPFLDASGLVAYASSTGLRGLTFHPDYSSNGFFFIFYDDVTSGVGDVVLARYQVSAGDPNVADAASGVEILRVTQTEAGHGGGDMAFGSDGYLYTAFGDGHAGAGEDPNCNAQDGSVLLGKMIRIDVDSAFPYSSPPDNPFVGNLAVRDEVWHIGLRHPWRWSFDRLTGDIYIGDVGQSTQEELDFAPAGAGGLNFGWKVMEGTTCFSVSACSAVAVCNHASYADPIHTLSTSPFCSVTGGFVYRGDSIPSLQGAYVFGDWCSGRVWSLRYDGATLTDLRDRTSELGGPFPALTSFGEDDAGELYIVQGSGNVRRIVPLCGAVSSYCTAAANSSGPGELIFGQGSTSLAANDMILVANAGVPGEFGLFYYGSAAIQVPFGDGFRCVGGSTYRLNPPQAADIFGDTLHALDYGAQPMASGAGMIVAGSTWNFQHWYRDPGGPGGTGFNLSNGLSAMFCP